MLQVWTAGQARLASDEDGATMVEYGVILALISIAAITILAFLGTDISNAFESAEANVGGDQG